MCFTNKQAVTAASAIFGIIAIMHGLRLIRQWPANIAGWDVPLWLSGIGILLAGYLSWKLWQVAAKTK